MSLNLSAGQHQQTVPVVATAATPQTAVAEDKHGSHIETAPVSTSFVPQQPGELNLHQQPQHSVPQQQSVGREEVESASVIPTSPQYGVAIIPTQGSTVLSAGEMSPETTTTSSASSSSAAPPPVAEAILAAETIAAASTVVKPPDENKELHSTPSRNDR